MIIKISNATYYVRGGGTRNKDKACQFLPYERGVAENILNDLKSKHPNAYIEDDE